MGPIALTLPLAQIETVMLASVRIAAFLVLAPPFSHRAVPAQVKVALALGLAIAVAPHVQPLADDGTVAFVGALVAQALVGAALGFGVQLVFSAVQSAGGLIDMFGGFQVASGYDPMGMTSGAIFQRFYQLLALVLLFVSDGYLVVVGGLLRTFDALPLDAMLDPAAVAAELTDGLGQMMLAALQIAGPLIVVLFLADVGLGLLTRVAPALNAFALGFPLKVMLTLTLSGFAIVGLPHVIEALTGESVAGMLGLLP
ncbi:flagellar biosynthetic protein FliR [Cellulomonas sp. DKR-3]|uniref:Flagellar biosynthetic protein FliR n=1 Tax=Cellulomonas fulva TaxID=2835530 RepID=A0ABS5TV84_9CELL|nr:flagellar biosynthetic protein FliR [Cellulomonas fulva]MBT0993059.1 flagellar biosynthetic protein FliR [Cellulomonas fulva]